MTSNPPSPPRRGSAPTPTGNPGLAPEISIGSTVSSSDNVINATKVELNMQQIKINMFCSHPFCEHSANLKFSKTRSGHGTLERLKVRDGLSTKETVSD